MAWGSSGPKPSYNVDTFMEVLNSLCSGGFADELIN